MENKFAEMIQGIKTKLNNQLSAESSADDINKITELSKDLDSVQEEYNKLQNDNAEIKKTLIDYVKRGSVDTKTPPADDTNIKQPRDFDTILDEIVKNKK